MVADDPVDGENTEPVTEVDAVDNAAAVSLAERVPPNLVLRWAAAGTLGALLVLLAAYGLYVVRSILVLVFIALFLAVSLDPPVRWLVKRGVRRSFAVGIVLTVLVGLFVVFVWSVVPPLVEQGGKLVSDLPGEVQQLSTKSAAVREVTDRYQLTGRLTSLLEALPARMAAGAVGFLQQFLGLIASGLTVLVLTIYLMTDLPRVRSGIVRLFPSRRRGRIGEALDVVVDKVGGYMIGNLIISLFAGTATFICLEIVGVPFALPLAVTVAITDLIPMIGATLGATVCVLVTILAVDIWPAAVIVLLFFILYQPLENYLLAPRVMRNTVDLSAMAVLIVALTGGVVLGLIGALIAIPVAAAVKVLVGPTLPPMDEPAADARR